MTPEVQDTRTTYRTSDEPEAPGLICAIDAWTCQGACRTRAACSVRPGMGTVQSGRAPGNQPTSGNPARDLIGEGRITS